MTPQEPAGFSPRKNSSGCFGTFIDLFMLVIWPLNVFFFTQEEFVVRPVLLFYFFILFFKGGEGGVFLFLLVIRPRGSTRD